MTLHRSLSHRSEVLKMRNRIHIYELEGYKTATEEKKGKLRARKERYFDLEGLPSENIRNILEQFVWERGKLLTPSSLASELLYFNNIREFLIEKNIKDLNGENREKILLQLKGWMLEHGLALTSKKYRAAYDVVADETPYLIRHMKKILDFAKDEDSRPEQSKDLWDLNKFDFPLRRNPIKNTKTINFTKIKQPIIREEVKKAVYQHLKYEAIGSILSEIASVNRFSGYINSKKLKITSLQNLTRKDIEQYLVYIRTEAKERKNYRTDLYALRRIIEDVGNLYEKPEMSKLFLNTDFPSAPRYQFTFYSDEIIKRLNVHIFNMDEQIARALILHQLLGTRISDTLTLKTDCLREKGGGYFIRIDQVKSITFEKAVSSEVAQLVMKAIDYTREHYGNTEYIFVKKDDPTKPYQYGMIQGQIMRMIREKDIRDDNGELLKFGTHVFRHCYGKKLTEMHLDDWMIARLLGHTSTQSVGHYRKMGNKIMADETRASREKMDMILLSIIEGWEGYEI